MVSSQLNISSVFSVGGLGPLQGLPLLGVRDLKQEPTVGRCSLLPPPPSPSASPHSLQGSHSQATHSDVVGVDVVSVFLALCPA